MRLLVTGGAGFIGSNFIIYALDTHKDWEITNLDKLTYAGNLNSLDAVRDTSRYNFVRGDITDRLLVDSVLQHGFDVVVNFAAESHVDRSILDSSPFIETNVNGTQVLLEGARKHRVPKFVQISTDEVYGSIPEGCCCEGSPLCPSSPYSASKAAADLLCLAYFKTHGMPVVITRCTNNFGPRQFPEKLVPLAITNALENRPIPVYGDGSNVRDWLFVLDHCRALDLVITGGRPGEVYNIGTGRGRTNLELLRKLLGIMGKDESLLKFVSDRPGHDLRYALDTSKLRGELGWTPAYDFDDALAATVRWYLDNERWWREVKSGEYRQYYERMYANR